MSVLLLYTFTLNVGSHKIVHPLRQNKQMVDYVIDPLTQVAAVIVAALCL